MAIGSQFGVQVAFRELLGEINTVALLAAHLDKAAPPVSVDTAVSAPAADVPQVAPLTEAQRELWLATALGDASSCVFNQSCTLHLMGPLQPEALESALQELVERHDGFRATFSTNGDSQTVAPQLAVELAIHDLPARTAELYKLLAEEAKNPFNLEHGPLLTHPIHKGGLERSRPVGHGSPYRILRRAGRWPFPATISAGHISDKRAGSAAVLLAARSLMAYGVEIHRQADCPERRAAGSFRLQRYSKQPPALELPADFPSHAQKSFLGACASPQSPPALCGNSSRRPGRGKVSPHSSS